MNLTGCVIFHYGGETYDEYVTVIRRDQIVEIHFDVPMELIDVKIIGGLDVTIHLNDVNRLDDDVVTEAMTQMRVDLVYVRKPAAMGGFVVWREGEKGWTREIEFT